MIAITKNFFTSKLREEELLKEIDSLKKDLKRSDFWRNEFEEKYREATSKQIITLEQGTIILDKKELLTSKMMMDMQKLANTDEYTSLRQYLLNTTITLYDRTATQNKEDAAMLCQFAMYVKSLVAEMDRMKMIDKAEQLPEDPYAV